MSTLFIFCKCLIHYALKTININFYINFSSIIECEFMFVTIYNTRIIGMSDIIMCELIVGLVCSIGSDGDVEVVPGIKMIMITQYIDSYSQNRNGTSLFLLQNHLIHVSRSTPSPIDVTLSPIIESVSFLLPLIL